MGAQVTERIRPSATLGRILKRTVFLLGCVFVGAGGCTWVIGANWDGQLAAVSEAGGARDAGEEGDASVDSPFTVVSVLPAGETLNAIWGADMNHVFAVGTDTFSYIYADGVWTPVVGPLQGATYNGISGLSSTEVYAVGTGPDGGGFIHEYNGATWSEIYTTPAGLNSVWCTTDGSIFAVGDKGGMYASHTGYPWASYGPIPPNTSVPVGPDDPVLGGIAGLNSEEFAVAGGADQILFFDTAITSTAFETFDPSLDRSTAFRSVWQAPVAAVSIFFGTNYYGLSSLTVSPTPIDGASYFDAGYLLVELEQDHQTPGASGKYVNGLWGTPNTVVAVGDDARIYTYSAENRTITYYPSPTNGPSLHGVWGSSLADIWIVGDRELILHGSLPSE
jgi:hypothetical protein